MTRLMPHFSRGGIHGSSDRLSAVARANLRGASIFLRNACRNRDSTAARLPPLNQLVRKGVFLYSTILDAAASSDLDVGNLMDGEACETVRIPEHASPFRGQ